MTIVTLNRAPGTGGYVVSEARGYRSREVVTIAAGSGKLVPGTVLGIITASSKYGPYNNDAATGVEVAKAILYEEVDATSVDVKVTAHVRDCEVQRAKLVFAAGTPDATDTNAALADLAAAGIAFR